LRVPIPAAKFRPVRPFVGRLRNATRSVTMLQRKRRTPERVGESALPVGVARSVESRCLRRLESQRRTVGILPCTRTDASTTRPRTPRPEGTSMSRPRAPGLRELGDRDAG
jgi:hypothetical protein